MKIKVCTSKKVSVCPPFLKVTPRPAARPRLRSYSVQYFSFKAYEHFYTLKTARSRLGFLELSENVILWMLGRWNRGRGAKEILGHHLSLFQGWSLARGRDRVYFQWFFFFFNSLWCRMNFVWKQNHKLLWPPGGTTELSAQTSDGGRCSGGEPTV